MDKERVRNIVDNTIAGILTAASLAGIGVVLAALTMLGARIGPVLTPWEPWLAGGSAIGALFGLFWFFPRVLRLRKALATEVQTHKNTKASWSVLQKAVDEREARIEALKSDCRALHDELERRKNVEPI